MQRPAVPLPPRLRGRTSASPPAPSGEHKLRSGLTILGIVVGVTTVIAMVAIVTGFNNNVIGNLQAFGANRIEFQKYEDRFGPGGPQSDEERRRRNLTMEDAEALRDAGPGGARRSRRSSPTTTPRSTSRTGTSRPTARTSSGADEFYPDRDRVRASATGRFFTPHGGRSTTRSSRSWAPTCRRRSSRARTRSARTSRSNGHALPRGRRSGEEGGAVRLLARQQGGPARTGPSRGSSASARRARRRETQRRAQADARTCEAVIEKCGGRPAGAPQGALQQAQRLRASSRPTS